MTEYNVGADIVRAVVGLGGIGVSSKMILSYIFKKLDEKQTKELCVVQQKGCAKQFADGTKKFDTIEHNIKEILEKVNGIAIDVAVNQKLAGK